MSSASLVQQVFGLAPRPRLNTASQVVGEDIPENAQATLDMSGPSSGCDTVIGGIGTSDGAAGNAVTIAFTADGSGAGSMTRAGTAFTYHYESGVSTVANFEAVVAALTGADALIEVVTAGTGATVLADPGDTFTATALTGGTDRLAGTFRPDPDHGHWSFHCGVEGTPTGTIKFYYSNLPYPDVDTEGHWVLDATDNVTLSGADSFTFSRNQNKVAGAIRVVIDLTAGTATAWGWATERTA